MSDNTNRIVIRAKINYPALFIPKSIKGSPAKYSACLLISKDDEETLRKYEAALEAAYASGEKKLSTGKAVPKLSSLHCPLHDGDEEKPNEEAYANCFYINASSREKPKVVDRELNPITDPSVIYSGCIVNASITLYAYKTDVSKGIAAALNAVQLVKRGERIGWGPSVENEFTALPEVEEDELPF